MSLRRRSGVSGKSKTASRKPKPYFFNANLYLTPKFTHFMAISSNMASKRSSQKEAMKPMLKVRESYSAMSFTDAAGGSSQTGINPPSSRNSLRGIVAFGKSPFGECGCAVPSTKHQAPTVLPPQTPLVPLKQLLHAVFNLDLMRPAEGVQFRNIDQLAHRAVRLGGVELHRALEAHGLHYQLRQFADGQLLARAHIDVAIANLAQRRDVPAAARRVVAVHDAVVPGLSPRNRCKRQMKNATSARATITS